jgi:hypothetical protein
MRFCFIIGICFFSQNCFSQNQFHKFIFRDSLGNRFRDEVVASIDGKGVFHNSLDTFYIDCNMYNQPLIIVFSLVNGNVQPISRYQMKCEDKTEIIKFMPFPHINKKKGCIKRRFKKH